MRRWSDGGRREECLALFVNAGIFREMENVQRLTAGLGI